MLFPILKALIPLFQLTSNKRCFSAKQQTKTVGLTNFVVNFFCFQTFLRSHSLDHYYNLLISREVNIPSWQMKVLQSCHLAHQLKIPYVMQHEISSPQSKFFCFFYSDHFTIEEFFEKLSLEPYMDVWIKVIDSTVHYNTENICKVHLCLTLVNVFFQYILTSDIHINCLVFWFAKPLYAVQVNIPASVLLMFVMVSTFPSCTTPVFPWFPGLSLVQVMFGLGRLNASQVNCKLLPSRTVGSPLIPVIFNGTKSNQTITSKL